MNKLWALLPFFLLSFSACDKKNADQNAPADSKENPEAAHDLKLYELHYGRGDINSAIYALNSLITRDTSYSYYLDTLALMYYREGNAEACASVVDELSQKRPEDKALLELGGVAHQAAGNLAAAAEYFEQLHRVTGDLKYRYQVATILLNMGEFAQTIQYADEIIAKKESRTLDVELPNPRGQLIKTKLLSAAYVLRGYAQGSTGKKEEAITSFRKALEVDPNFELAAEAINDLLYRKKR